ncbi:glucoside xylosyltransferase 1-like [Ruditapes philippinarum]|uniref:glucoside xylosyltransferase 1-like n=1 Tax=Ruditapes philippinarum TaxID=129788 RepID=UPI00295A5B44|nr:glucoside xylosyltransferase 1-like [Ruditapes philippinarum]XP_060592282.1 glucoside xylosyltransferase 1-like [Ruditapes philippinarum]
MRIQITARAKMLFKIGLTVIILVAVYMYYAINLESIKDTFEGTKDLVEDNDLEISKNEHTADDTVKVDDVKPDEGKENDKRALLWKQSIHIAVVSCGDRMEESLIMFKSAVLFSTSHLVFHIFTEPEQRKAFEDQLDFWPTKYREKIDYRIYNITFPSTDEIKADDWRKLFKPCACQRLFIPELLTDVDALIYVDTDVLFLSPVDEIWAYFHKFNSTQLAALANEHEDKAIGWYNRFARHPYYGVTGVNSGVMLMNLTRLRASSWLHSMSNYYKEYKLKITWGDQDLINIYFHYYPDQLYLFSCEMNYRPDHCMYMSICKPAEKTGAFVLHGCRRVWFNDKQPAFKAVYSAFKDHYLGGSIKYDLLISINKLLKKAETSNCGNIPQLFTKQIDEYIIKNS